MIFSRFLTPKRKPAPLPEDQDALIRIVQTEEDTAKRLDACRHLLRLADLRTLAADDVDAGVREIAQARYRKLLCGQDEATLPLEGRLAELAELAALSDQRHLELVAGQAAETEVRLAAMAHLTDPEAIANCALNDPATANRTAAVERLEDKHALERIARGIGKKDKGVYRIARRKLREIAEREALPERIRQQCQDLCERAERLGRFESWVQDRALLEVLDRQWAEVEPAADAEWTTRYRGLRTRFLDAYDAYRREHEAQIAEEEARAANRAEREQLIEALGACTALAEEAQITEETARIAAAWQTLAPLSEKEQAKLTRRYEDAAAQAEARREELETRRKAGQRLRRLVAKAEKTFAQAAPLERQAVRRLADDAKPLLDTTGLDKDLVEAFAAVRERLDERLRKQAKHAEQRIEEAAAKLTELEAAIERGELKHAEPLFQSLQATVELAQASGLARKLCAPVAEHLHALGPRMRDLQKWRKWGTDQHREALCETMEALEGEDIPLAAKTLRLHDLQMEWKSLDQTGSPVNHPMWNRFHAASDRVYACCKPYLDQQAAERAAAREEREALCRQLEDFLDQVDWERVDWKKAQHAEREMRQAWAAAGEVEGRHRRALEKRFRAALKRLDDRLTDERNRNQQYKRDLIAQVEALTEAPDLERAIEETKRLQRQWHTTVAARQKDENKLWQRFRAACDAVFARRRQQHEAYAAELTDNLKTCEALCAEAEALTGSDQSPEAIATALRQIETRWRDAESLPIPRQAENAIGQRWRTAHANVLDRRRAREEAQRREAFDLLAGKAAVCERLERALEAGTLDPSAVDQAQAAWEALPRHGDERLQTAIAQRFNTALAAAQSADGALIAELEANGRHRAELCLHLEILARVDSPPELTQERLAFQVDRLRGRMRAGEKDPLEGAPRLLEEWYLCGPAPAADAPALDARFQRARAALETAERETRAA
jgi:hypothetical protein